MRRFLSEPQFHRLYEYLQSERKIHARKRNNIRQFLEAVFWLCRSGSQWEFLPESYGKTNSVYKRFSRWAELGVWYRMFRYFAQDADMESVMLDSTIVRAHACAAGG